MNDAVLNLQYSDIDISMTTCDKILGIQVDENVTWNSHFNVLSKKLSSYNVAFEQNKNLSRGGVAQWIGRRISDQGVPGSIPRRCTFRCGLEQVTFTLCLVLVKPRKRWTDDQLGQTVTRLEITLCLMC